MIDLLEGIQPQNETQDINKLFSENLNKLGSTKANIEEDISPKSCYFPLDYGSKPDAPEFPNIPTTPIQQKTFIETSFKDFNTLSNQIVLINEEKFNLESVLFDRYKEIKELIISCKSDVLSNIYKEIFKKWHIEKVNINININCDSGINIFNEEINSSEYEIELKYYNNKFEYKFIRKHQLPELLNE